MANRLMKLNFFSSINQSPSTKKNMLSAAIAAGITIGLGAPLGGVVFSIEATASIYIVSNLWKSFFASVICIFTSKLLRQNEITLFNVEADYKEISKKEIILFVLLGLLSGIVGAMFSTLIAKITYIRRKSSNSWLNNRFKYGILISLFISHITFFNKALGTTDSNLLNFLFSSSKNRNNYNGLMHPIGGLSLTYAFLLKFFLTFISLTVNMPSGLLGPFLATGALLGRVFGHMVYGVFGTSQEEIYAMVGAACVLSGASHTISGALIIFEITGKTSYLAPLLLATLVANLTAQSLSMSIFDVLLTIGNLPHISNLKSSAVYGLTAENMMTKNFYSIKLSNFTIIGGMEVLQKLPHKYSFSIPIVNEKGQIQYTVKGKHLYKYIYAEFEKIKNSYNIRNQSNFEEFFSYTYKKLYGNRKACLQYSIDKFRKIYYNIKDSEKLKLSRNFEEDANYRLVRLFRQGKNLNLFVFLSR